MLDLASFPEFHAQGTSRFDTFGALAARMIAFDDPAIFITIVDDDGLRRQADDLLARSPAPLPLNGELLAWAADCCGKP